MGFINKHQRQKGWGTRPRRDEGLAPGTPQSSFVSKKKSKHAAKTNNSIPVSAPLATQGPEWEPSRFSNLECVLTYL
jgi:hypothetical protein